MNEEKCLTIKRENMKPFSALNVKDWSYYSVWVSMREGNPPFKAILYTGASSGGYRSIHNGDSVFSLEQKTVFIIIKHISELDS